MANSVGAASTSSDIDDGAAETPPSLGDSIEVALDYKGRPVVRSQSGGWRSACFIIGVEMAERFAMCGISSNLISYLTGPLGQSTAMAAANVNAWTGAAALLPLLGALVADLFVGRYSTIIIASLLFILGLGGLTLSAVLSSFKSFECQKGTDVAACFPSQFHTVFFFFALYLVAVAQGGQKPCVQAFGADQFDGQDPTERKAKSSYFNWGYFGKCGSTLVAFSVVTYVQDKVNWGLGFGIPCLATVCALIIFLLGTMTYRFPIYGDETSPLIRISQVFARVRNWKTTSLAFSGQEESQGLLPYQGSEQFKSLTPDVSKLDWKVCSMNEVAEAKAVLELFPIWATCLVYAIVFWQSSTLFTKQGISMDRYITPSFEVPAASLQSFTSISVLICIPIYDQILVPVTRAITGKPTGITKLQRIGTGMLLSFLSMVVAALVERKRLETAQEYGLVDKPRATVPMSVMWLLPQYILFGINEVFAIVGLQEFFYDQMPGELKSVGLALHLGLFGIGSFTSSFLIFVLETATGRDGHHSWFSNNLNAAHLDYFYWLLAGLSAVAFAAYLYFTRSYINNR